MNFKQVDFIPDPLYDRSSIYRDLIENFIAANIKMAIVEDFGDNYKNVINSLRSMSKNYDNVEIVQRGKTCYLRRKF